MKTLIITPNDFAKLSEEIQSSIMKVIEENTASVQELKKRIASLRFAEISADGTDISTRESNELIFNFSERTHGQSWGNCAGTEYTVNLGRKYIKLVYTRYSTNNRNEDSSIFITRKQLDGVLKLVEAAEACNNDVDSDKLYTIAEARVSAMTNVEEYY